MFDTELAFAELLFDRAAMLELLLLRRKAGGGDIAVSSVKGVLRKSFVGDSTADAVTAEWRGVSGPVLVSWFMQSILREGKVLLLFPRCWKSGAAGCMRRPSSNAPTLGSGVNWKAAVGLIVSENETLVSFKSFASEVED